MSPTADQHSEPKSPLLNPAARAALGKVSPVLLKQELLDSLMRAIEDYSQAAQELLENAELENNLSLDNLFEQLQAADPVRLANELAQANPQIDLSRVPKQSPLEPLKAILAMLLQAQES